MLTSYFSREVYRTAHHGVAPSTSQPKRRINLPKNDGTICGTLTTHFPAPTERAQNKAQVVNLLDRETLESKLQLYKSGARYVGECDN